MKLKKIAYALALAGIVSTAQAGDVFMVNESTIPGCCFVNPSIITADKLTLRYEAGINQTAGGSFTESGFFNVTGLALGASPASAFLNTPNSVGGYQLYGTFLVSGTVAFVGTTALATFTSGNFFLYADPDQDTTKSVAAGGNPVIVDPGAADDILLASSNVVIPVSEANVPLVGGAAANGGSYRINYANLTTTAAGAAYFFNPSPFFQFALVTGENESFTPTLTAGDYQGKVVGDASVEFTRIPEPTTLLLLGAGLAGLGFSTRRKAAKSAA